MSNSTATVAPTVALNHPKKRKRAATSKDGPREPRPKPIQCPVCFSSRSPHLIHTISTCNCTYCTFCLREVFSVALQQVTKIFWLPAMCCDRVIDYNLFEPHLTPQLRKAYKARIEEDKKGRDSRLYCGKPTCKSYILEDSIKNGFGSCGKCKIKTCIKRECNRPRAQHLGIYAICPNDLETEELRILANEKGWKRCPKCYVLTERTLGCNDIRCICRTEWCYACGKPVKDTKNACQCHPLPPPRPQPQTAQDEIQVQREVVIIRDEDDASNSHDTDMVDVKPSIEGIANGPTTTFHSDLDLIAELHRRAGTSMNSTSRIESDVMTELDNLAVPNPRGNEGQSSPTLEDYDSSLNRQPTVDETHDTLDTLEDMLQAFQSYEAARPESVPGTPFIDLDSREMFLEDLLQDHTRNDLSSSSSNLSNSNGTGTQLYQNVVADDSETAIPERNRTPVSNTTVTTPGLPSTGTDTVTVENLTTILPESNLDTNLVDPAATSTPATHAQSSALPASQPQSPGSSELHPPQTSQTGEAGTSDTEPDWLMDSIEEYLGIYEGDSDA